ncbi:MAG: fibronectin type III domain-containing protein [Actinomycetota bacterium]|nr:fibronectin type III domain-containing protein [Actinomycetota bacterium]
MLSVLAMATSLLPAAGLAGLVNTPAHGAAPVGQGFNLNAADLRFILQQIKIAERHAATATPGNPCGTLLGDGPDQIPSDGNKGEELPWGLRTLDGTCNNLLPGQSRFGAADQVMPRAAAPVFRDAQTGDPDGPGPAGPAATSYTQKRGIVIDSQPRVISNLIVDQSPANPAAQAAAGEDTEPDDSGTLMIPNTAPDAGLSAPYNSMFTLFGQFFDHGLDLTNKGGGTVFMPLRADDPLIVGQDGVAGTADDPADPPPPELRFMVLTRATNRPGPDGVMGTGDDVQNATNQTSPFVDQNQTYTSHPSHQVFLRDYAMNADGDPVSTGRLINGPGGGMGTWASVKQQARNLLGLRLRDTDALNVPLLATDPYGRFIRGANGFPQVMLSNGDLLEGDPAANGGQGVTLPLSARRTGHAFLDDIAHHAVPVGDLDHDPATPPTPLAADGPGTNDDHDPATYDDEMLGAHYVAGDGRVNENIGLTAVHHVFHAEHNRLTADIKQVLQTEDPASVPQWQLAPGVWNGERIFQAAKFVTEMEYQHLAFEEFARKVQPQVNVFAGYDTSINPAIMAEFAHTVYRFGHSMLTESVDRVNTDGSRNDIALLQAFLNPPEFTDGGPAGQLTPDQAAGSIFAGMSSQVGNEIDEFVTEALRNRLLGLPLDLATINLARGRDTGIPPLNVARGEFYAETNNNSTLRPYASWFDFGLSLRHPESLTNFVAAYGTHPSISGNRANRRAAAQALVDGGAGAPADALDFMRGTGAWANQPGGETVTGLDDVDFWVGGLAEKPQPFGGLLGSSFNYIFEMQMENLQDGDRFYYLSRTAGLNLLTQLEGNSFAEMVMRNTGAEDLPGDMFASADLRFKLANLGPSSGPIQDDETTPYDETTLLTRMVDETVRYAGELHVIFNGTTAADRIRSSEGDDTIRANDGNDRVEAGSGNDLVWGGLGNDILSDLFGDDDIKGGDGHDAIQGGSGFDLLQPGRGDDFVGGGEDPTETLAGPGDDLVFGGQSADIVIGGGGNDWVEGGGQADELIGDSAAVFQDDLDDPGHDVFSGDGGADEYDAEGGDDIMVSGPGVERNEGMRGYDWVTHTRDPQPADSDMNVTLFLPPTVEALRDRFGLVEGLSGWRFDDVLRGDDGLFPPPGDPADPEPPEAGADADEPLDHVLDAEGIARIDGLAGVLPAGTTEVRGNILLGGDGDDTIEGRGGDDVIDGDAWLDVQLLAPDLSTPVDGDTRLFDSMGPLQDAVFAGDLRPSQISVVRQVRHAPAGSSDSDTAVFSDLRFNYDCRVGGQTVSPCPTTSDGGRVRVTHAAGTLTDGTDVLTNVEHLVFADSVPPSAPTGVTATGGNESATVQWNRPRTGAVSGFTVQAFDTEDRAVGLPRSAGPDARSLRMTGLVNDRTYVFKVRASNAAGDGAFSAASNPVVPETTAPGAPTIGTVVAGNRQVTVRWATPADNGGEPVDHYAVKVITAQTDDRVVEAPGTATRVVVDRLTNGTPYRFQVTAVNAKGAGPASEESATATPGTVPSAPRIGTATARDSAALVTWRPPLSGGGLGVDGYRIRVINAAGNQVGALRTAQATHREAVVRGLRNGRTYRFRVAAVNAMGQGAFSTRSNQVRVSRAPTALAGRPGGRRTAKIRWSAPATATRITGYRVTALRMESRARDAQVVRRYRSPELPARARRYTFVLPRGTYRFRVVALSRLGRIGRSVTSRSVRPQ